MSVKQSSDVAVSSVQQGLMRNGVTASCVYLPAQPSYPSTLAFLCQAFPHISAVEWRQRFDDGLILTQQGEALTWDSAYLANQKIYYYRHLPHEIEIPFQHMILYEDDYILVVDKPHFLPVTPTGKYVQQTLLTRLKQQLNMAELTPIHRLDKDTAGLILFSKQKSTRGIYQQLFAQQQIQKIYHAIAPYCANLDFPRELVLHLQRGEPFYTMQVRPDQPANSRTKIKLLQHDEHWAKYQLEPQTGKMHQLRVHMNYLNLPLKNDELYPLIRHRQEGDFTQPLQLLAYSLQFIDPIRQKIMSFQSQQVLSL